MESIFETMNLLAIYFWNSLRATLKVSLTKFSFLNFQLISFFLFKVNLNFFGDKHGKNSRDSHFSNIAKFIKDESLVKKLGSTQDIVDAIIKRQLIANENKKGNVCNC